MHYMHLYSTFLVYGQLKALASTCHILSHTHTHTRILMAEAAINQQKHPMIFFCSDVHTHTYTHD